MAIISILTDALRAAIEQKRIVDTAYVAQPRFLSIDEHNIVREHMFIPDAVFPGTQYIIGCLREVFQNYGWSNNYGIFTMVNSHEQVREFQGEHWVLKNFKFFPAAEQDIPFPRASFALRSKPDELLEFESYAIHGLQPLWTLFVEINEYCRSVKEAEIYIQYYLLRLKQNDTEMNFNKFKDEVQFKDDLLSKYDLLIKRIERLVGGGTGHPQKLTLEQ